MLDPIMASDEKKENDFFPHTNDLFRNCMRELKDSIIEREKNSMKTEKMSSSKKEIEDLLRDVETTTKMAQSVMEENAFLFGPLASIKSHTRFRKSSVSFNNKAIGDSSLPIEKNSDDDDLEILDVIPVSVKKTLPHFGPLKRKKLAMGSKVWIMGRNIISPFVEGRVLTSVHDAEKRTIYKVQFENEGRSVKMRTAKEMAYKENCDVIVPVGTHIIALYEKMMFAGVVAEHPTHTNKNRYLIFFDDNHAEYIEHKNIHVICDQSDDVADDVYENFSDFIRTYLKNYPERALVKFQKNQRTKTEYDGKWERTIVLDTDGSLVKMYFIDKNMTQWIYRGCERFELISDLVGRETEKARNYRRRVPRRNVPLTYNQPYVEFTRDSEIAVYDSVQKDSFSYMEDKYSCLKKKPTYRPHICSHLCEKSPIPFVPVNVNPFIIPECYGWERKLILPKMGQNITKVMYITSCGRTLESMKEIQNYLILISSKLTIDLFTLDHRVSIYRTFKPNQVYFEKMDISDGKERIKISCVNTLNKNSPPYVDYCIDRFPGKDVNLHVNDEFLCGCSCVDNCQDSDTCECQKKTNYPVDSEEVVGYKFRRLKEVMTSGIYECNSKCKCGPSCGNRVIQNGIKVHLQVFYTSFKGWGVRCLHDLEEGTFVCVYVGEIKTEKEAEETGVQKDEYFAELDLIESIERKKEGYESDAEDLELDIPNKKRGKRKNKNSQGCSSKKKRKKLNDSTSDSKTSVAKKSLNIKYAGATNMSTKKKPNNSMRYKLFGEKSLYILDAQKKGNVGRYLNHSCTPNCFVQNAFIDTHDLRFPQVGFFTKEFIPAGTELTWDYSYEVASVKGLMKLCYCDSKICRGRLL